MLLERKSGIVATYVSREDYFAAALRILAEEGAGRLKLVPLCRQLGISTGSFYHYFGGWQGFRTALLEHWVESMTARYRQLADAERDPERRARMLIDFVCALPHDAEAAIRAWARSDNEVRQAQARVDGLRMELAVDDLSMFFGDRDRAWETAHLGMCLLVGYQDAGGALEADFLRRNLMRLLTKGWSADLSREPEDGALSCPAAPH